MKQKDLGLDLSTRRTRKQTLLDEMEPVMPWGELLAPITPHSPAAKTGRPPFDLAMMLRIHCLQQWFGLSDLGAEEALFETSFYCAFVGISGTQHIPERVSILRFRHLLEEDELSPKILQVINAKLAACGLLLKTGTVVDATLIAAPSSTKNSTGERDPEMHQTKKGNPWNFGMKAHIGVDTDSGFVHTVIGTGTLPCGRAKRKAHKHTPWGALSEQAEKLKASVRAKVEHQLRDTKRQFGFTKVRYRRLKKNTAQLITLFALSNIWMARSRLLQRAQA